MRLPTELNVQSWMITLGERVRSDTRFVIGVLSVVMGVTYPMFSFNQVGSIVAGLAILLTVRNGKRVTPRGRLATLVALVFYVIGANQIRTGSGSIHAYIMMVSLAVVIGIELSTRGSLLDED